jgi:succinyl-CoA synthetase alpha subunit
LYGGDPIIGTTTKEAVELLMNDPETECIVMIGEIGGQLEADAAHWIKTDKPVVGFIAELLLQRVVQWVMPVLS